jgi:uncharacterized protein YbaP (TraB family)
MKKFIFGIFISLLFIQHISGQQQDHHSSLLWKVTGKDLKEPSYLFGTLHLLTNAFIDTMPAVKESYAGTKTVVGELVIDSSLQLKMMEASALTGTTLKQVLPDSIYAMTSEWFAKEAGIGLEMLDGLNPMSVMTVAMAIAQQKHFPNPQGYVQLDSYFQERAKQDGKKVIGLETIDVQINALFHNISLHRQAELLYSVMGSEKTIEEQMSLMYNAYVSQDLMTLNQLMYDDIYKPEEIKVLLDDRNISWIKQLPKIMKEQPAFIAVGALHLTGEHGLVELLRKQGYTVTAVKTNR